MPDQPATPVSRRYSEDGQTFLKVDTAHAISEDWLNAHTPDLYALWRATADPATRHAIARCIDTAFTHLELLPAHPDPAPGAVSPTVSSIGLYVLIDEYEASLIAHPERSRGTGPQYAALAGYIDANALQAHPLVRDLRLRDWAEQRAPSLLAGWQHDVVAAGDLHAGAHQITALRAEYRRIQDLARRDASRPGVASRSRESPGLSSRRFDRAPQR